MNNMKNEIEENDSINKSMKKNKMLLCKFNRRCKSLIHQLNYKTLLKEIIKYLNKWKKHPIFMYWKTHC